MKKHLIVVLIIILIAALTGTGIWLFVRYNNVKPLYKANCEFVFSEDTTSLTNKITQAQTLYNQVIASETRLVTLNEIISKINNFERDLNSYLVLLNSKSKTTKKLSKSYTNLTKTRSILITDYDEYITRMSGDINADGPAIQNLYNDIFNKTVDYLYDYISCFSSTSNYVFSKVYTVDTIKAELYSLYSLGVNELLNNISNNQFAYTIIISRLNNVISLTNGNMTIKSSIIGGEFSQEAFKFKQHFNNSDLSVLIDNFNIYYGLSINVNLETSNEKLAVYYAKKILEI